MTDIEPDDVQVFRQVRNVDIVLVVNRSCCVLIEDKTTSLPHGRQLERYLADDAFPGRVRALDRARVVGLYLKTGNEQAGALPAGWTRVTRADLLRALPAPPTGSDILDDFRVHLERLEMRSQEFRRRMRDDNDMCREAVEGFYGWLDERQVAIGGWGSVSNPAGGFVGRWWGERPLGRGSLSAYLQKHDAGRVFVRLSGSNRNVTVSDRDDVWPLVERAVEQADEMWCHRCRFRGGRTAAVAELGWTDQRWRVYSGDGALDEAATTGRLRRVEAVLLEIVQRAGIG